MEIGVDYTHIYNERKGLGFSFILSSLSSSAKTRLYQVIRDHELEKKIVLP